jgi:homoaconitase/3-isopropylmalate dehydratase large subunit
MFDFDARGVTPFVIWGTSPDQAIAFDEHIPALPDEAGERTNKALDSMELTVGQRLDSFAIDHVFFGWCTNALQGLARLPRPYETARCGLSSSADYYERLRDQQIATGH